MKYILALMFGAALSAVAMAQQVPHPVNGPATTTSGSLAVFDKATGNSVGESRLSIGGHYYPPTMGQGLLWPGGASQDPAAVLSLSKTFDTGGLAAGAAIPRPTLYSVCKLNAVGTDNENKSCRGIMSEAIDNVGGFGTFVEGGKFVGIGSDLVPSGTGGAYGVIAWGQSTNSQYTVGIEAQTVRTGGTDAPGPYGFNPSAQMTVNFLASNGTPGGGVGKRADAGFLVNPFNGVKTMTGFGCGAGSIESTSGTCFVDFGGGGVLGMDLSLSNTPHTLGSILIGNSDPILIKKADHTSVVPALYVGGDNVLHLNSGVTSNTAVEGNLLIGGNLTVTPASLATTAIILTPATVATLPTCNVAAAGWLKTVSDAAAPVWGGAITAGGTVQVLALCNGATWVAH